MTVVALLSVAPVREGSMAADVASAVAALDDFDVTYETNPMGTVIEADDVDTLLAAVGAAHGAVDADRVSTFLKIDDKRTSDAPAGEKVAHVERHLGRPARGGRRADGDAAPAAGDEDAASRTDEGDRGEGA
jgi:uncharacterized protein (TIGR00106 family)